MLGYYNYKEWKQNKIDSANDRNNTNTWTKTHKVKAKVSLWQYVKALVSFIFRAPVKQEEINLDFTEL